MSYHVTGPLAVVHDQNNKIHYVYQGGAMPDTVSDAERDLLIERGLVSETDAAGTLLTKPSDRVRLRDQRVERERAAATDDAERGLATLYPHSAAPRPAGAPPVERPARVAPKTAWVDYAVAAGMDRQRAESLPKEDLISACEKQQPTPRT